MMQVPLSGALGVVLVWGAFLAVVTLACMYLYREVEPVDELADIDRALDDARHSRFKTYKEVFDE